MRTYLLIALVAAIITYLATPLARHAAFRMGAVTAPRERDIHTTPIPRLGGLAIYAGLLGSFWLASMIPFLEPVFHQTNSILAVLVGGGIIVAVGIIDDIYDIPAWTKLAGQVLGAVVMAGLGVQFYSMPLGGLTVGSGRLSMLVTTIVVVVLINCVNFIDGLDGLAAGVIAIGAIAFFIYTYDLSRTASPSDFSSTGSLITAALVGVCLGFLPHNFHPARIFMGDSGAMLLGLVLSAAMIVVTGQIDSTVVLQRQTIPVLLPILVPLAVMAVPLVDLILAVVRRSSRGQSPFAADKEHLHHKLLELGHSHRGAVLLMYAWTAVIALGTAALMWFPTVWAVTLTAIAVLAVALVSFAPHSKKEPAHGHD